MKECEECGKKLGILKGYQHPTLGKKYLVCSKCFDNVSESVKKWREFVLTDSVIINNIDSKHGLDSKLLQEIVKHGKIGSGSETI